MRIGRTVFQFFKGCCVIRRYRKQEANAPEWRVASGQTSSQLSKDGITRITAATWSGEFERLNFDSRFHVSVNRINVLENTELEASGTSGSLPVSLMCMLAGKGKLRFSDGTSVELGSPYATLVVTPNRRGWFDLPGPQKLQYFSVAFSAYLLKSLMNDSLPFALAPFAEEARDTPSILTVKLDATIRKLLLKLVRMSHATPLQKLQMEGVTLHYLAEVLNKLTPSGTPRAIPKLSAQELSRVRMARELLTSNLRNPPTIRFAAETAGLGVKRLLQGFHELYEENPSQLLRRERLEYARDLLQHRETSLKEVAWQVGYNHASNFINAFTDHFGESPRRLVRTLKHNDG